MDTDKKLDSPEAAGQRLAAPKSSSRRRLLQAGIGASPALLTIVSGPVRAYGPTTPVTCRSASSFASTVAATVAGVVTSGAPLQTCLGVGPASWNASTAWPVTKATALFSTYYPTGVTFRGNTSPLLVDITNAAAPYTPAEILIRQFVAAMLNVLSGGTPATVTTQAGLATIFPQALAGTYTPIAGGTPWTVQTTNAWLFQTFSGP
jgi:hypothetical protein